LDTPKETPIIKKEKQVESTNSVKKLSYKEQKELDEIEQTVTNKEAEIESLAAYLNEIEPSDYNKIQDTSSAIESLNKQLETIMERWVELSEKTN
jgi:ATP-binding cassette subfamily F protein uup